MNHQTHRSSAVKSKSGKVRIGLLSLGCSKTLVDSEVILGKLDARHYSVSDSVHDCDIALLNTCSFIGDATKQSVGSILDLLELKKQKKIKALVVMGCLVQKFPEEVREELREVDAFIGSGDYQKIPNIVGQVMEGEPSFQVGEPGYLVTSHDKRIALTPKYSRFLKISEGCDHICTFCTIPQFRGAHRSRTIPDVIREAKRLLAEGAREIILTGQDTTFFGRDLNGKFQLPELLRELDQLDGLRWLRLLYAYPSCVTEDLMQTIADSKHICHYLDMPLQHASDRMLSAMKRGITQKRTADLIRNFRSIVPDLAIRTTFIVGFPGETSDDFSRLKDFIQEMRFERLGVFTYSNEASAKAHTYSGQVPERIKEKRKDELMRLQQTIAKEFHEAQIGSSLEVLVEDENEKDSRVWHARSYRDAPEVDGIVKIKTSKRLTPGRFISVTITGAETYDLLAVPR